jgi:hypothetical protein
MKNEEEEEEEEAQKQVINIMLHCFRTHSRKLCPQQRRSQRHSRQGINELGEFL